MPLVKPFLVFILLVNKKGSSGERLFPQVLINANAAKSANNQRRSLKLHLQPASQLRSAHDGGAADL